MYLLQFTLKVSNTLSLISIAIIRLILGLIYLLRIDIQIVIVILKI